MNKSSIDTPIVIFIAAPSVEISERIATALLEQKLAACVNILPAVHSIFRWQGEIHDEQEVILIVKSRLELFADRLVPQVLEIHPYDVPEIIALPILAGSRSYLEWIASETQP